MKISFNTRDITFDELVAIQNIINDSFDEIGNKIGLKKPETKVTVELTGTPAPDSFTTLDPNERFVPSGPVTDALVEMVKKQVIDSLNSPTSEEYEPDDEDESLPVVPPPPSNEPETHDHQGHYQYQTHTPSAPIASVTPPPPPVAAIAQVLPLPPQPTTTLTVTPPSPPSQPESVPQRSAPYVDPYDSQPGDLDSDGTPWDATIHSESRAKNVDGTWRKRRVNKNVEVKAAIAGLEAITPNSVPAPPVAQPIRATPPARGWTPEHAALPPDENGNKPVVVAVPPPPPAAPPVVKTAAPGAPAGTWPELMERVTKYFGAQKITSVDLAEICKTFNIGSVQECFTQPHLIPLVSSAIDAKAATKVGG